LTTGIFINIAAHAAEETKEKGEKDSTPYWRTLKTNGVLNHKFPGGVEKQKKLLEEEGFTIIGKGKTLTVKDYEQYLVRF
ncbi:MAG: MGMT family protein, partial [Candidatus Thermoplasmatota archaeon]|nr:MGMT family protein [Candidatus Thermoplasmatota archaeon]